MNVQETSHVSQRIKGPWIFHGIIQRRGGLTKLIGASYELGVLWSKRNYTETTLHAKTRVQGEKNRSEVS